MGARHDPEHCLWRIGSFFAIEMLAAVGGNEKSSDLRAISRQPGLVVFIIYFSPDHQKCAVRCAGLGGTVKRKSKY